MLHHLPNKAHRRRLSKELLSMNDWQHMIADRRQHPVSLSTAYSDIISQQFNLHLLNYSTIEGRIKFVRGFS